MNERLKCIFTESLGETNIDINIDQFKDNISRFLSDTSESTVHESVLESVSIKNKRMLTIFKVVLRFHDVMEQINRLSSFETSLAKMILSDELILSKRSDVDEIQEFSLAERVMIHFHLLCDLICNRSGKELNDFILMIDKACGRNRDIFGMFHGLYHKVETNVLKQLVLDTYIYMKMLINIVYDEHIKDGFISMNSFNEHCDLLGCDITRWNNQYVWMLIVQNAIYIKRMKVSTFEMNVYNQFLAEHGGNLLNVLSHMYLSGKNFNVLYNLGMIYSLTVDLRGMNVVSADLVSEDVNQDGTKSYKIRVNDMLFDSSNGIISVGYTGNNNEVVCQVIEKQTDGYVYHDVYSTKEMNTSGVCYFDEIGRGGHGPMMIHSGQIHRQLHGGQNVFVPKFSGIQMTELSEIATYAICFGVVVLVVCMIIKEYRRRNKPKIEHATDDTVNARLLGAINPQVPMNLI